MFIKINDGEQPFSKSGCPNAQNHVKLFNIFYNHE